MNHKNKKRTTKVKEQTSSINGLQPLIIDAKTLTTGDNITYRFNQDMINLDNEITRIVTTTWTNHKEAILNLYKTHENDLPKSPTGITDRYKNIFQITPPTHDKKILAKNRIQRLAKHRLASETLAWYKNDQDNKGELKFSHKINFGGTDKQICIRDYDKNKHQIIYRIKCWEHEYVLIFQIPDYIYNNNYNITKFCNPIMEILPDKNIRYSIPFKEKIDYKNTRLYAAYDLGIKEPFVLSIITSTGSRVAVIKASARLHALNDKRERVRDNLRNVKRKLDAYEALGLCGSAKYEVLRVEAERLSRVSSALGVVVAHLVGYEVACACEGFGVCVCAGEDLSWVSVVQGSSGWVHGLCEDDIVRACARVGVVHSCVSAAFSSQSCVCGSGNVFHDEGRRTVCRDCGYSEDRDSLASFILALRLILGLLGLSGGILGGAVACKYRQVSLHEWRNQIRTGSLLRNHKKTIKLTSNNTNNNKIPQNTTTTK